MADSVNVSQLLGNVARFYREALRRDRAGQSLAASLGLHDPQVLDRFQVGYANGSVMRAVPSKGGVRDVLADLGLIGADGKETALGCLLVPVMDKDDQDAGFVAISRKGEERRFPAALPMYGANREAFREKALIFTDSALKMLLLAQAGQAAVPLALELSQEERSFLSAHRPDRAYFSAELPEALKLLQKLEVPCFRLSLALPATPAQVEQALQSAEPIGEKVGPDAVVRVVEDLVRFDCGSRRYEVKELAPGETDRLRVRVRAQGESSFHLDTLDLYAGRSRSAFARAAAPLFGVPEAAVEADLGLMIVKLEAIRAARKAQSGSGESRYAMTPDEEAEALAYLKKPDLLDQVVKDLEAMGYVGEEANKKLGYLITVSRKLDNPLCGVIISRAAAGKSRLMESLAALVPPEDLVSYTRITPQALYYAANRSLKNKLLVSGEDEGLLGSDYALRELISSKKIRLAAPVKDPATGKMKTVEYEVEGPISLLFSTTQPAIHYENATRCFTLSLDESAEQTERVMRFQLGRKSIEGVMRSLDGRDLRALHRNVQRLLKPLLVVNPFAQDLKFPAHRIESRREHEKYLSLVEAIALLHQHQRPIKRLPHAGREVEYVEVTKEDIAQADRLMAQAAGAQETELSGPSRKLLELIWDMVQERSRGLEIDPKAFQFNRRDIREHTGWSDNQIKAHVKRLEELEFLAVKAGDRGRMYRYQLASWQPVGQKLGEGEKDSSVGDSSIIRDGSWEVGRISERTYTPDREVLKSHS